jgi:hypothetical protein
MYLVVHFMWVQPQHMKYNNQIYLCLFTIIGKIVNLYLYVIKTTIEFIHDFPKSVVVFKMRSLYGRSLWQNA